MIAQILDGGVSLSDRFEGRRGPFQFERRDNGAWSLAHHIAAKCGAPHVDQAELFRRLVGAVFAVAPGAFQGMREIQVAARLGMSMAEFRRHVEFCRQLVSG